MGVGLKVRVEARELKRRLRRAASVDLYPAWASIGELVVKSVQQNFDDEGRPDKWAPLKRERRTRRGPKSGKTRRKKGQKILTDTARLRNSITYYPESKQVVVSTNVVYAARHHFGFRGPGANTPARPFLLIQDEDEGPISKIIEEEIAGGLI